MELKEKQFSKIMLDYLRANKELVILCIGTGKAIFDSVGPLVGTFLKEKNNMHNITIYGDLHNQLTALNIEEEFKRIKEIHPNAIFVCIDACLSEAQDVGRIILSKQAVCPGKGIGKDLTPIGDYSIKCITKEAGPLLKDATNLKDIYDYAKAISNYIYDINSEYSSKRFFKKFYKKSHFMNKKKTSFKF